MQYLHFRIVVTRQNPGYDAPPAYQAPMGAYYAAPPPAYAPPPSGYYGWVPPTNVFPDAPPGWFKLIIAANLVLNRFFLANAVFMTDMPPPYPGLNSGDLRNRSGYGTSSSLL